MKVGRWRRDKLGQGDSHTREVVVVLLLLLLFGAYRLSGVSFTEQSIHFSDELETTDVLISMPVNLTIRETFGMTRSNATLEEQRLRSSRSHVNNTEASPEPSNGA